MRAEEGGGRVSPQQVGWGGRCWGDGGRVGRERVGREALQGEVRIVEREKGEGGEGGTVGRALLKSFSHVLVSLPGTRGFLAVG